MTFIRKEKAKERKGGKSLLFPSRAKINEKNTQGCLVCSFRIFV
jgi:hypothetical protein